MEVMTMTSLILSQVTKTFGETRALDAVGFLSLIHISEPTRPY